MLTCIADLSSMYIKYEEHQIFVHTGSVGMVQAWVGHFVLCNTSKYDKSD